MKYFEKFVFDRNVYLIDRQKRLNVKNKLLFSLVSITEIRGSLCCIFGQFMRVWTI